MIILQACTVFVWAMTICASGPILTRLSPSLKIPKSWRRPLAPRPVFVSMPCGTIANSGCVFCVRMVDRRPSIRCSSLTRIVV